MTTTRKENVMNLLLSRGSEGATGLEFLLKGGGMDWRKRISELRAEGKNVNDTWVKVDGNKVKKYWIEG